MRILIVDDHPLNLKLLRIRLEAEGEQVLEASDGQEALALLSKDGAVDAIVSDIVMPNMDGYRLCYELRHRKGFEQIPFVFYSNRYSSPSDEQLAIEMGGDAFIPKPSGADQVLGTLKEIVQRTRAHGAGRPRRAPPGLDVIKRYSELLVTKLEEQLEISTSSLKEREALLREVHHRVKNNLQVISSLLRLEASRGNAQTAKTLHEMEGRVQSMAALHDMLCRTGTLATTDLGVYLRTVASQMYQRFANGPAGIALEMDFAPLRVDMDVAMPCGLIVNELLSSCLRPRPADGVRRGVLLWLRVEGRGDAILGASDRGDGLAFDVEAQAKEAGGLGFELVRDLARQLRGELSMRALSPGTEISIRFPI
jgi:two-component sensor histidine kinase/FixJ family two-component response regulator